MPSAAKKLVIVPNDQPAADTPEAIEVVEVSEAEVVVEAVTHEAPGEPAARPDELRLLEALLFAAGEPLDEATLSRPLPVGVNLKEALAALQAEYATRGVNLVKIGRKWTFRTAGDLSWLLTKNTVETRKLSRAAIETLAIIAYHQPVTRSEIEEIRGVAVSKGTLEQLMELDWVRLGRRRMSPGRPVTFVVTELFLDHFGLESARDLPGLRELRAAGLLDSRPMPGSAPQPDDDLPDTGQAEMFD